MTRSAGLRRKTRRRLKRGLREKLTLPRILKSFEKDDKVLIKINSTIQKGMPDPKFYGRVGIVIDKMGECYKVKVKDGGKEKKLCVHPTHLKKLK